MRQVSLRLAGAFVMVIAAITLLVARPAVAGPIVSDISGSAHVLAHNLTPPDIEKSTAISGLGSGSLSADDPVSLVSASNAWTLTESPSGAHFQFDLAAFGGRGGEGTADGNIKFTTHAKGHFKLLVRFLTDYGVRSFGDIDGQRAEFIFNFQNPEPGGEKTLEGDLDAGDHLFTASTFAPQTRSNPLRSDGSVSLDLAPGDVTAIPLPAAFYPGSILLACVALWIGARRLEAKARAHYCSAR